jgi:SulP family sulfate permease
LAAALIFAPWIKLVPMSALAAVLMVTAWRMNEWHEIRWMFRHRFYSSILLFFCTLFATAYFDLTEAVIIGVVLSSVIFIARISRIRVHLTEVDLNLLEKHGKDISKIKKGHKEITIAYITGPMFFGAANAFRKAFDESGRAIKKNLILSMRGVPLIDVGGLQLIEELHDQQTAKDGTLLLCAVQPEVRAVLDRAKVTEEIGKENFFWSADEAIFKVCE